MTEAIRTARAFNLIHLQSGFKIDIFPSQRNEFSRRHMARRSVETARLFSTEPIELWVSSCEDTIMSKLVWFRSGGERSERQWNDVRGVMQANGEAVDRDYLREWAPRLVSPIC